MSIPGSASPLFFQTAAADAAAAGPIKSVRLNSADSAYLNRSAGADGNLKTYTYSFWVKRAKLVPANTERIIHVGDYLAGSGYEHFYLQFANDQRQVFHTKTQFSGPSR